jgi:hypothetical protein
MTGRHDARPFDPARVDRLHQRHVEQDAAGRDEESQVPDRRESGAQRGARVDDAAQGAESRILLHRRHPARGPAHQEIDLHVHEAWKERQVSEVDDLGIPRQVSGAHRRDALPLDENACGSDPSAAIDVQQPGAAKDCLPILWPFVCHLPFRLARLSDRLVAHEGRPVHEPR